MPGIIGAAVFGATDDTDKIVTQACKKLDPEGRYKIWKRSFGTNLTIARAHLDIFNRDPQPFSNSSDKLFAFLEGEIYLPNTVDRTHSNAQLEYIVDNYKRQGIEFASKLNGSFLAVIYDAEKGVLVISTDRLASRPLYYAKTAGAFYFSPEIKGILPNIDISNRLDEAALAIFLTNGYLVGDCTFFEDIKVVEPGTAMSISLKTGEITKNRYWEFRFQAKPVNRGEDYYVGELSRLARQAVERATVGGYKICVPLSGGYDSRTILESCLGKLEHLSTATWGVTKDKKDSDAVIARSICQKLNIDHMFLNLDPLELPDNASKWVYETEGTVDEIGNYPNGSKLFEKLRENFDVLLRGDHCFDVRDLIVYDRIDAQLKGLLKEDVYRRLEQRYSDEIRRVSASGKLNDYTRFYTMLNYYRMKWIEIRTPLLDNDILDFILRLPLKYLLGKSLWIKTVKNTFPILGNLAIAKTNNLPDWPELLQHDKKIQDFVVTTLTQDHARDNEFIRMLDLSKVGSFVESCLQFKSSPPRLRSRLYYRIKKSRLWSSRFGSVLRERILRRLLRGQRMGAPEHVMLMRLVIMKLWFDRFMPSLEVRREKRS